MWCNKVGAFIFKSFYLLSKFLGLTALEFDFKCKVFRTSRKATLVSCGICVFVAVTSPFVVKLNSEIYLVSGAHIDDNMSLIATTQFCFGFGTSLVVLVCQLWKRHNVCRMAKNFQKVLNRLSAEMGYSGNIITPEMILLIAIKFSITMYEVLINFPYIIEYGDIISPEWFVAFFLNLYIAEIAAVFSDIVFATMLLLARCFYLLDEILKALALELKMHQAGESEGNGGDVLTQMQIREYRKKLLRLLRLYTQMRRMVSEFARCIEISILVQMLNTFANTLTNLYALLDFYVQENYLTEKDLVYIVMIFSNICLVLLAAERVKHNSKHLRNTLLDLDASQGSLNSEWRSDVLAFKIWPEVLEVNVLGMFPLDNTFLLFLISYSINFVVIILQFIVTKALFLQDYDYDY